MMCSFILPGGLAGDADDDWLKKCRKFVDEMPGHIDEYEDCVTENPFFKERTIGIGMLKADEAIRWGVSGPLLRSGRTSKTMTASPTTCAASLPVGSPAAAELPPGRRRRRRRHRSTRRSLWRDSGSSSPAHRAGSARGPMVAPSRP
jgi:hypothetical protein